MKIKLSTSRKYQVHENEEDRYGVSSDRRHFAQVGVIVLANSSIATIEDGYGHTETFIEGAPYFGAVAAIIGVGGLGAGIPLAIVGSKSKRKYEAKVQALSFRIQANPKYSGLTLAYRF